MASYLDTKMFADLVRGKRGSRGLRAAAQIIGNVSPSTISRVEREQTPDLETFFALCDWLEIPPAQFVKDTKDKEEKNDCTAICTKLRSDACGGTRRSDHRTLEPKVAEAIAVLIEFARDCQRI
jgi:transcriptional regulator with XRE-family HTH domain